MNRIEAKVTKIERCGGLTVLSFDLSGERAVMAGLELTLPVEEGSGVVLGVKATRVALAKEFSGNISIANSLKGVVEAVDTGELLCSVKLHVARSRIESILTAESARKMSLQPGDEVTVLIEASDLFIIEANE